MRVHGDPPNTPTPLRDECSAVRSELAQRHKGDLDCALAELCALKDQAMRDAAVLWSEERNKLTEQVSTVKLETEGISEQKGGGGGCSVKLKYF